MAGGLGRLMTLDPSTGLQHFHWQGCRGHEGVSRGVGASGGVGGIGVVGGLGG